MKVCTKCGGAKPPDQFKVSQRSRDGRFSHCKSCEALYRESRKSENAAYMREYYSQNRERLLAEGASYHASHREKRNAYTKTYYRARRLNNLEGDILARTRYRAKKHGILFDLERTDIVIPTHCPVLGMPLDRGGVGRRGPRSDSPSIDRIDPSEGYLKGNVRVISHRANTLKGDASIEELEKVLADLRHLNQSP